MSLYLTSIVELNLPSVVVSELECTTLCKALILENPSDALVSVLSWLWESCEAPTVHTTTYTHCYRSNNDLCTERKVITLVKVEHDVIKASLLNLHCRSVSTCYERTSLKHAVVCSWVVSDLLSVIVSENCAITNLLTVCIKNELEILTALENNVLLVHTSTLSL